MLLVIDMQKLFLTDPKSPWADPDLLSIVPPIKSLFRAVGAQRTLFTRFAPPEDWQREDNSLKWFSAGGLHLQFDESREEIRFIAGDSMIIMHKTKGIALRGARIVVRAENDISAKCGDTFVIDGAKIYLG